jgi:hypothetical protein
LAAVIKVVIRAVIRAVVRAVILVLVLLRRYICAPRSPKRNVAR